MKYVRYVTMVEVFECDDPSSLFRKGINYDRKSFKAEALV